ncbi:hypothetical protein EEB14_62770, partial [Rhodococcus sp. WS4]
MGKASSTRNEIAAHNGCTTDKALLHVRSPGFPLEIGCFEGNKAETHTIVPIVRQFQARHDIEGVEMVVAAD